MCTESEFNGGAVACGQHCVVVVFLVLHWFCSIAPYLIQIREPVSCTQFQLYEYVHIAHCTRICTRINQMSAYVWYIGIKIKILSLSVALNNEFLSRNMYHPTHSVER